MKTLYLAPGVVTGNPSGTLSDPIRVNDARDFDNQLRQTGPTRFILHPGEYETHGAWAFPERAFASLGADCELIGLAGSAGTTIRLSSKYENQVATPTGNVPAQYIETIIAGARVGTSEHLRIEGITVDCKCDLPVSGVHTYSGRAVIRDVRVINLWGDYSKSLESFGIVANNCQVPVVNGGNVIEHCRVEEVKPGAYITSIYCGVVDDGPRLELSHVSQCWVYSALPGSGKRSHAAYAANYRTRFSGCYASGFDRWFFCDTGDVVDLLIEGCTGDFNYCAVDLPGPVGPRNPIRLRSNIRVVHCSFGCPNPSADHAILILAQDGSANSGSFPVEDVLVCDCTIRSAPTQFYAVSIKASKAQRIRLRDVLLPVGAKTRDGVFPPTAPDAVTFS